MRKKANAADIMFIAAHAATKSVEEISKELDLSVTAIKANLPKPQTGPKLGRSKIKLNGGTVVYQMTEDIEHRPVINRGPASPESDIRNGIYRPE